MAIVKKSSALSLTLDRILALVKFNKDAFFKGRNVMPVLIVGAPGIGKSFGFAEFAKSEGMEFHEVHLDNMAKEDVGGMPVPCGMDTDHPILTYAPNKMFVFHDPEPGKKHLLLLDELTSCEEGLQLQAMQLVLNRAINGHPIPDNVYIVAAGNRSCDRSKTHQLIAPLANRFAHYEVRNDPEKWCTWGRKHGVHPKMVAFIAAFPQWLHAMDEDDQASVTGGKVHDKTFYTGPWNSNRTVVAASEAVWELEDNGEVKKEDLFDVVAGVCGEAFAHAFSEFYDLAGEYDNVREVMLDESKTVSIPQKADKMCAFSSALVFNLWRADNDAEQEKLVQGFYRIMNAPGMVASFANKIMTESLEGSVKIDTTAAARILVDNHIPEFQVWQKKYGKDSRSKI